MAGFDVQPDALDEYANTFNGLNQAITTIGQYAEQYGCDKSGFTGLLTLLHPGVDLVNNLFGETLKFGQERMVNLQQGVTSVAQRYRTQDDEAMKKLKELLSSTDSAKTDGF